MSDRGGIHRTGRLGRQGDGKDGDEEDDGDDDDDHQVVGRQHQILAGGEAVQQFASRLSGHVRCPRDQGGGVAGGIDDASQPVVGGIALVLPGRVFGTLKIWMGSAHFLMKGLKQVATEMNLHVLAYNLRRVMNILGIAEMMKAIRMVAA